MGYPIHDFGFVKNNSSLVNDLSNIADDPKGTITFSEINNIFKQCQDQNSIVYWDKQKRKVDSSKAQYAIFPTGYKNRDGEILNSYYIRDKGRFIGLNFATENQLNELITRNLKFIIGDVRYGAYIVFDNHNSWPNGLEFLEKLKERAIDEPWGYGKSEGSNVVAPYKILISYLGTILLKVKRQDKFLRSDDGRCIIFNTGLLDQYFEQIYIMCYVKQANYGTKDFTEELSNPILVEKIREISGKYNFLKDGKIVQTKDLPLRATFFDNLEQIFFQTDRDIDMDSETYEHIVKERINRLPDEFRNKSTREVATSIKNAIKYAKAMAELNYKFIVPQCRPETPDTIQFLMPLYLSERFERTPDVALVIKLEQGFYVPETILPLDWAYQNSRVIAKPDETWLNPGQIASSDESIED
jgi:hypothetical protein